MTVDGRLVESARLGAKLSNFILAHEIGHLALDHHKENKVVRHFQLFTDASGMKANLSPTLEELEANYAAVFFQCGVTLLESKWEPERLADRAKTDLYYVKLAQRIVQLDVFKNELARISKRSERVIL